MAATLNLGTDGNWGVKEDSLLGYNSENENYKPLPFDFTRASSATVVNKAGLIETVGSGEPRIDFSNDAKGALLLEPQRTNIITNSNSSNLNFALDNVSMTYNSITSPSGENNGILFKQTGNNSSNSAYNFGLTTANGTYTYSIFLKANDSTKFRFYSSNGTAITQDFNPQEMTEGVLSGALNLKFKNYGNGWFKVSFTRTLSSASHHRFSIFPDRNNTQKSVYIYGVQVEQSSYATSYIPTQGASATRLAESCSQTPPSGIIGQTDGTVYWEINVKTTVATGNENILNIDDGSGFGNTIYLFKTATGSLVGEMYVASVVQASFTKTNITKGVHKMAMAYANNNTAFFVDGVQVGITDTSCTVPNLSRIQLGNGVFGPSDCLSNDLILYNTRLSNAELQDLTTI